MHLPSAREPLPLRRLAGLVASLATHLLLAFTIWHVFWFLKGDLPPRSQASLAVDFLLAMLFAVPHSLLLLPNVRKSLSRWISPPFYGLFFCCVTCTSLLAIAFLWQPTDVVWFRLDGTTRRLIEAGYLASWIALLASIRLTGFGYQTGWTPWSYWWRRQPLPRREFEPRGAYLFLRHPVYLSFLGLIWFTPVMTVDRALLVGVWTAYIFVGSHLKDRRLEYFLGDRYRAYQVTTPGFPGMPFGPLARIPWEREPQDELVGSPLEERTA